MNDMTQPAAFSAAHYKSGTKPIWCPGCGDFSVLSSVTKAFALLQLQPHEVAVVSGIGCSSRIPAYTACYGFHGVHGRSLAAATGLKVARPDLTVLVAGGDGDGYSIGGNHFLHACRRNVDLTYIVMDNHVYGMTSMVMKVRKEDMPTIRFDFCQPYSNRVFRAKCTRFRQENLRRRAASAEPADDTVEQSRR